MSIRVYEYNNSCILLRLSRSRVAFVRSLDVHSLIRCFNFVINQFVQRQAAA